LSRPIGAAYGAALTFEQIAARTGIPRSTVYRDYRRALRKIEAAAQNHSRRSRRYAVAHKLATA
jgi:DNA-directed RNA polymerase specialized sigma24 family protein